MLFDPMFPDTAEGQGRGQGNRGRNDSNVGRNTVTDNRISLKIRSQHGREKEERGMAVRLSLATRRMASPVSSCRSYGARRVKMKGLVWAYLGTRMILTGMSGPGTWSFQHGESLETG